MKRLLSLILCSSAIMLTIPTRVEARPPSYGSINPGVHRSFPRSSSSYRGYNSRSFSRRRYNHCYNCASPTPYRRGYHRGYYRGYRQGQRDSYYDQGYYGRDYPRRDRGRAGISIYYETYP